ncbi:hypothetical protein CC80DRAFT_132129 [Byssothecium circinans]|uniref:Uncharacterized protein n=1 Tax=Byssothecium circinans TaxID=147558 RepID=A0A6A5TLW6_9PLEO|nr:hypothetical protein CC80DRAFT_132129 [Byssothecium circinans]
MASRRRRLVGNTKTFAKFGIMWMCVCGSTPFCCYATRNRIYAVYGCGNCSSQTILAPACRHYKCHRSAQTAPEFVNVFVQASGVRTEHLVGHDKR